jgi:transposase-like protein
MSAPACPFCGSSEVEFVSPFAGQIITSQFRCRACNTYFEAVREDFEQPVRPQSDG